jgi:predicted RNA binding protein YcfA (HicA-like mRNA interferase family)
MPYFGPISRRDLIAALRQAGFDGPRRGSDHQLMVKDDIYVKLRNPHRGDISILLLKKVLRQAHISRVEWEKL